MSEQQVIEGNKKIAEFMGGVYKTVHCGWDETSSQRFYLPGHHLLDYVRDFISDILYHSSFDWLMPVVTKIRKLGYYVVIEFSSQEVVCQIRKSDTILADFCGCNEGNTLSDVTAVWLAVVNFLEWENNKEK